MSDPAGLDEIVKIGTSVAGGGGMAGLFIKLLFGSALSEVKAQVADAKAGFKEQMSELKADTREQISSLKEMIERSDRRHDKAIEESTTTKNAVMSLHARVDSLEADVNSIKARKR